jgi:hypothetical protein
LLTWNGLGILRGTGNAALVPLTLVDYNAVVQPFKVQLIGTRKCDKDSPSTEIAKITAAMKCDAKTAAGIYHRRRAVRGI